LYIYICGCALLFSAALSLLIYFDCAHLLLSFSLSSAGNSTLDTCWLLMNA